MLSARRMPAVIRRDISSSGKSSRGLLGCIRNALLSKKPKPEGMFPVGFWERPVPQKQGDANAELLFSAVGRALTSWETVEKALALICLTFSETSDDKSANAVRQIFGSIESSAGRRSALYKLFEVYFSKYQDDPPIKTPFNQLMDAVSSASKLRDDIAHGIVTNLCDVDESGQAVDIGCFLVPSSYNTGRNRPWIVTKDRESLVFNLYLRGKYRYTASNVLDITTNFNILRDRAAEYAFALKKVDGIPDVITEKLSHTSPRKSE